MELVTDATTPAAHDLSGVLVHAAGHVPRAGVVLLGGSEGGLHERDARVLAEEGFAVLALAYFGADGVPAVLKEIPLEYFSRAIDLLVEVGVERVGLLGGSRGGEAALLVAARDPRVAAVVSIVGSGVVTPGIDFTRGTLDKIISTPTAAWTVGGDALPALPHRVTDALGAAVAAHGTVELRDLYAPLPTDPAELDRISIPIERSRAAVLMVAAEHDAMWDSPGYHAVAADRLSAAGHPFAWSNVVLTGAGHAIAGPPGKPLTGTTSPGPGVTFEMGGDPGTTTAARAEAWRLTVGFLREHLA